MIRGSNPTMSEQAFEKQAQLASSGTGMMTVQGTIQKTGILLAILVASAAVGWNFASVGMMTLGFLTAFILAVVLCFKPSAAPVLAPIYAVLSGYGVGVFSVFIQASLAGSKSAIYANAVPVAILGTFVTLGVMLTLYVTRIIKVTETLKSVIIGATLAIVALYLFSGLAYLVAPAFVNGLAIFKGGPIGIAFSVFVIGLAAFNFLLDFDVIERGSEARAPKYMEWYGAFGLLVTIVWLYIEILRLLSKLGSNR